MFVKLLCWLAKGLSKPRLTSIAVLPPSRQLLLCNLHLDFRHKLAGSFVVFDRHIEVAVRFFAGPQAEQALGIRLQATAFVRRFAAAADIR